MPTLILLGEANRDVDVPTKVTHLVEEFPREGDPEPEFYHGVKSDMWYVNGEKGEPYNPDDYLPNSYRFARSATPAEIAAHAPSVGRDELVGVLVAACKDALTCIATTTPMGSDKIDDPGVRSAVEAQCDYMDRVRKTLRAALAAAGKGE